jgi:hypothetical protein
VHKHQLSGPVPCLNDTQGSRLKIHSIRAVSSFLMDSHRSSKRTTRSNCFDYTTK